MKMLGYCGLNCGECPARIAFLTDDDDLRKTTAEEWSKLYKTEIKPENVNCTGCREEGVKFPHCESGCEIRKCALPRSIGNCSECPEFSCEKIEEFFTFAPEAGENLRK